MPEFQVVREDALDAPETAAPRPRQVGQKVATDALMLALRALSQRALIAIDNLFTLITVAMVFWLWMSIPNPSTFQIVSEGIFAVFVLAANVIVRRTK